MTRRTTDTLIVIAIATVALVVWTFRVIRPATVPLAGLGNGDLYLQLYPMAYRASQWMRGGVLPLWNPYQFAGQPFLATGIYGVLYPFNAFYLLLPAPWGMEAVMVFHLIVAGITTYAYARVLDLEPIAAATAAIAYMLSGFLLGEAMAFPPAVAAAAWLPLMLIAVERIVERQSLGWTLVLALAVAFSFLSGWPQTWLYSVWALALYAVTRLGVLALSRPSPRRVVIATALLGLGLVAASGITAAQLLPSLELQSLGPRQAGGLSRLQLTPFGVSPPALVAGQAFDASAGQARSSYLGISALLLMPLAALIGSRLRARAVCFAVLAVFALGVVLNTPLAEIYFALPRATWFRSPARLIFWYAFAGAMLSGMGMEVLGRGASRRGSLGLAVGALAAVGFIAWSTGAAIPPLSRTYLALTAFLIAIAVVAGGRLRRVAQLCLLALIVYDLGFAVRNAFLHPIQNPQVFDAEAMVFDYVKAHQGLDRTYIAPPAPPGRRAVVGQTLEVPAMPKQGTLREIYSITDYEPLSLNRYRAFYEVLEAPPMHIPSYLTYTGKLVADPSLASFRLLDLLSVRFIAVTRFDSIMLSGLARRASDWRAVQLPGRDPYLLFERTDVLPRAYVAFDARYTDGAEQTLSALRDPGFDPRRTVVLEEAPAAAPAASGAIVPARIVSYEPRRIVIETDAAEAGHLVLTDTFYPGWDATVDGEARPIVQANYLFRAVALPAGRHVVTFDYAPASFRIGAAITLLTLAAMAAVAVRLAVSENRARRSAVPPP